MGEVVQFPEPRRDHLLLHWDTTNSDCRVDIVRRSGARQYVGAGKDYLSVRDAARECAREMKLPLVDRLDPILWIGRRR